MGKEENNSQNKTMAYYYMIFGIITAAVLMGLLYYTYLFVAPKILTASSLPMLPVNSNDAYPILLQGLIIAGGVILGLFGPLFVETLKEFSDFIKTRKISLEVTLIIDFVLVVAGLFLFLLIIGSIIFSINGIIYYGTVNAYITTQINANIIHTVYNNGSIILINGSYFSNNSISIASKSIKPMYELLLVNSKEAITSLFAGITLLLFFIILYLSSRLGVLDTARRFLEESLPNRIVLATAISTLGFFALYTITSNSITLYLGIAFAVSTVMIYFIVYLTRTK
jgi:hypothetical protein